MELLTFLSELANWRFRQMMQYGGWSYDNAKYMIAHWEDYTH